MKEIRKQIRKISNLNSLLLLIFLAAAAAGAIFLKQMTVHSSYFSVWRNEKFLYSVQEGAVYLVIVPLLLFIFGKTAGKQNGLSLKSAFKKPKRSFGRCVKWTVICIGTSQLFGSICTALLNLLFRGSTGLNGTNLISSEKDVLGIALYFVPIVLFAPFFEELLFRACIFRNTEPMGQWFAAIVTGVSFGLWHYNTSQLFMASVCGIFLCLMYIKTQSIIVPMAAHCVNNFLSFLITVSRIAISDLLSVKDYEFALHAMLTRHTFSTVIFFLSSAVISAMIIAGVVLLIVQLVKKRGQLSLDKGSFEYGKLKKAAVFFSAPVTILAFAGMIAATILRSF